MSVRSLRRGAIAASRASIVVPNTTYTLFGDTSDGWSNSVQDNLDVGDAVQTTGDIYVGQNVTPNYAYEGFLAFDTSSVDDAAIITSVTLSLYGMNDSSTVDFTLEARLYDWGATLTAADFRSRAQLGALSLMASIGTASWNAAGYNVLTSEAAFTSNVNKTGFTRLILCSSRHRTSQAASSTEYVGMRSADQGGTTNDPKLVIEAFV